MRSIIRQLKALKSADAQPNETWLKNNRELLLSQIKNTVPQNNKMSFERFWQAVSIFLPNSFVYGVLKPATVLALVLVLGTGSWIATVDASYESLPGEWLYSAKRATEQTQMAVASVVGSKNSETQLHVEFAKRRAIETKQIISSVNDPNKLKMVIATVKDLKNEMQSVSNNLEEIKTDNSDTSAVAAQTINTNVEQIKDVLKEVKDNLVIAATVSTNTPSSLAAQVSEAKDLAKDTSVKAVEIMVAKHLQGDDSISKEDVKLAISEQLQAAVKDTNESKQSAEDIKKAVDVVNNGIKEQAKDAKNDVVLSSSTQILTMQIDVAVKQTTDAVNKTQQISTEADKRATETQVLLSQGNLAQAVDKIKEASEASKAMEKLTDDTIKAVQNVLPVVAVIKEIPTSTTVISVVSTGTPASSASINIIIKNTSTPILNTTTTAVSAPKK